MSRQILLWRHGQTAWNAQARYQGQLDVPLDGEGTAQTERAAARVAQLKPAAILTSDLQRASATAAVLASLVGLPAQPEPRLREIDLGSWQGLTRGEAQACDPDEYALWSTGVDVRRGGGETHAEVAERAVPAVLEALADVPADGLLVVATHGGVARATTGALLTLELEQWWRLLPLGNCCWSLLVEAGRGWRLAEHNVRAC